MVKQLVGHKKKRAFMKSEYTYNIEMLIKYKFDNFRFLWYSCFDAMVIQRQKLLILGLFLTMC